MLAPVLIEFMGGCVFCLEYCQQEEVVCAEPLGFGMCRSHGFG